MSETDLDQIRRRFSDAYRARDYAESARLAAAGLALAEAQGDLATATRMRVWLGESHWQRKESAAAVAALQPAAAAEPPADPGDVFNAISTLLNIALIEQPLAEIEALLAQGDAQLEASGRQHARHMLDLSRGELAARRGDWPAAREHFQAAYAHQRGDAQGPRFTLGSYLIKLAEASFMLGDRDALLDWSKALNQTPKEVEGDRLRAEQARLLCYRAGIEVPPGARGGASATARRVLCWLEEIEGHRADYARDALHTLLLQGDWLSVETWLDYPGIGDVPLMRGDLHLARARDELGLPARDLDWPGPPPAGGRADAHPARPAKAPDDLAAARAHYEQQHDWARREDERLATDHHQRRLDARLQQVEAASG
jgi:hypothetical protein